jgi:hypothetical protein
MILMDRKYSYGRGITRNLDKKNRGQIFSVCQFWMSIAKARIYRHFLYYQEETNKYELRGEPEIL